MLTNKLQYSVFIFAFPVAAAGGINIAEVQKKLRKEDKLDRETERERIKAMHKEKRSKDRERRKADSVVCS